jgi:heptose I phosphotransferase
VFYLNEELQRAWQQQDPFDLLPKLDGKVYRQVAQRKTFQFDLQGKSYFAKFHYGVGWREILKNLVQLRSPILSARNEWEAIRHLERVGVDTMTIAGYGKRGLNPAAIRSFIITEALQPTISLEDFCRPWREQPPRFIEKRRLTERLATISRKVHCSGLCHRDYYLCHFLLDGDLESDVFRLSLIDLHRALIKRHLPMRWIVKDVAGLYYSAMHLGLSRKDLLRFIRVYEQASLREVFARRSRFWQAVESRAAAMYKKLGAAS